MRRPVHVEASSDNRSRFSFRNFLICSKRPEAIVDLRGVARSQAAVYVCPSGRKTEIGDAVTRITAFGLLLLVTSQMAMAQTNASELASLQGNWGAKFADARGTPRQGVLKISGSAGTWEELYAPSRDLCATKEVPIEIVDAQVGAFTLIVYRSKLLRGCENVTIQMRRTPNLQYSGTLPGDRIFVITRR